MDFIEIDSGTSEARLAASELQGSSLRDSPLGDSRSSDTVNDSLQSSSVNGDPQDLRETPDPVRRNRRRKTLDDLSFNDLATSRYKCK